MATEKVTTVMVTTRKRHGKWWQRRLTASRRCAAVYRELAHAPTLEIARKFTNVNVVKAIHPTRKPSVRILQASTATRQTQDRSYKRQSSQPNAQKVEMTYLERMYATQPPENDQTRPMESLDPGIDADKSNSHLQTSIEC